MSQQEQQLQQEEISFSGPPRYDEIDHPFNQNSFNRHIDNQNSESNRNNNSRINTNDNDYDNNPSSHTNIIDNERSSAFVPASNQHKNKTGNNRARKRYLSGNKHTTQSSSSSLTLSKSKTAPSPTALPGKTMPSSSPSSTSTRTATTAENGTSPANAKCNITSSFNNNIANFKNFDENLNEVDGYEDDIEDLENYDEDTEGCVYYDSDDNIMDGKNIYDIHLNNKARQQTHKYSNNSNINYDTDSDSNREEEEKSEEEVDQNNNGNYGYATENHKNSTEGGKKRNIYAERNAVSSFWTVLSPKSTVWSRIKACCTKATSYLPQSTVLKRTRKAVIWPVVSVSNFVAMAWSNVIKPVAEVTLEVSSHWFSSGVSSISPKFLKRKTIQNSMRVARTYSEWRDAALQLDTLDGNLRWKMRYECPLYDYELVRDRLEELYTARTRNNLGNLMFSLRSHINRELGNITNPALYTKCVGTKNLIEQYIAEACYDLQYLADHPIAGITEEAKIKLFAEMRASFGRTALLLSGGGGLGVFHFGVLKALHEEDLLPRIISGSSVGSLIGALICTTPDEELDELLGDAPALKSSNLITREGEPASFLNQLNHLLRCGVLADVEVLKDCCKDNIGDVTFQEAYNLTHRILNITVNSPDEHEAPRLLNYLTAPNVVIWSAACASCALTFLFQPVEILAKDKHGQLRPWNPPGQKWSDGSVQSDLPMKRLSELLNVNSFIVSQVNPHIVPVLHYESYFPRFFRLFTGELEHRLQQLSYSRWMPHVLRSLLSILQQIYKGDITIVPDVSLDDYLNIITNPTPERFRSAVKVGQLATWPKMAQIENHLKIELTLDDILQRLRGCERWQLH